MAVVSTLAAGAGARRRRWWLRPLVVGALLLLTPVVELTVLVLLARGVGWAPVLGLVALACVCGVLLVRRQAPRTWRQLRESLRVERLAVGRLPGTDVLDGALVLLGGVLLAVPGLVTDLLAAACLLPFVRPALRSALLAWVRRRAEAVSRRVRPPGAGRVVRSEVVEDPRVEPAGPTRTPRGSTREAGRPGVVRGRVIEGPTGQKPAPQGPAAGAGEPTDGA